MIKDSPSNHTGEPAPALISALRKLLTPLVRLLLAHRITQPFLAGLLKPIYIQVAEQEFQLPGKRQSNSRISLITGLHRKDVQRLRMEPRIEELVPDNVSLGTQLISTWVGDTRYLDVSGSPRPLPRRATESGEASFEQLVASVSRKDLRARVVLDELIRLGIATVDDQDFVRLNVDAFVPDEGFEEKAFYFGLGLQDHIAAGVHNLLGEQPPFMERGVFFSGLSAKDVEAIEVMANRLGMDVLKKLNAEARARKQKSGKQAGQKKRISFGIYFYSVDDEQ